MRGTRTVVCALSFLTGAGILVQWIMVWAGAFPVADTVPGFRNYFLSFVAADMWLVLAALATGTLAASRNPRAALSCAALGSAMVFFGLYALMYDFNTGLLFDFSAGELFGKAVTAYNIIAGVFFMVAGWKGRWARSERNMSAS